MRGGEGVRNEVERKLCFGFRESVCMCVCMCVCERERERERGGEWKNTQKNLRKC